MARVKPGKSGGKSGGKPSITRHPLFPATVALWFGALFGVGSLAIRPSLIEGLIVASGIDAIIPAAAPPMGVTTRILIALALAAMGGSLGAWLARRITRPKPKAVQRRRAAASADDRGQARAGGSRRAKLAIDEGRPRREYAEPAPLPGGGAILDVSQFDLDGFEADEPVRSEPAGLEPVEPLRAYEPYAPVDPEPRTSAAQSIPAPGGAQVFQPLAEDPVPTERAEEAPGPVQAFIREEIPAPGMPADMEIAESDAPAPFSRPASIEASEPLEATHEPESHLRGGGEPVPFAAPTERVSDEPRFDAAVPAAAEPPAPFAAPREQDAAPAEDFPAPAPELAQSEPLSRLDDEAEDRFEPLPPKVRPGSIFDQKPATALFTQPLSAPVSRVGWDPQMGRNPAATVEDAPVNEPGAVSEPADQPAAPAVPAADPVAAERIAGAPLDDLSHVELLERLALSMRRRQAATAVVESPQAEEPEQPVKASEPAEYDTEEADQMPAVPAQPPVPVIPAALRPVGFDEDDDADLLPAFVPPRDRKSVV